MVATLSKPKTGTPIDPSQYPDLIRLINGTYSDRVESIAQAEVDEKGNIIAIALDDAKRVAFKASDNDIAMMLLDDDESAKFAKTGAAPKKKKNCTGTNSFSCGFSCISKTTPSGKKKVCHKNPTPEQKALKTKIVKEAKAAVAEVPAKKVAEAPSREDRNAAARERARLARVEAANERNKNSIATMADGSRKQIVSKADKAESPAAKVSEAELKAIKEEFVIGAPTSQYATVNTGVLTGLGSFAGRFRSGSNWAENAEFNDQIKRVEEGLAENTLDFNNSVGLAELPKGSKAEQLRKIRGLIASMPEGSAFALPENSHDIAKELGITATKKRTIERDPDNIFGDDKLGPDASIYVGVVKNGKLRSRTPQERKDISRIREIREEIPQDLVQTHYNEDGDAAELSKAGLARIHKREDKLHEELDAIENRHLGRKPTGKVGDYASYEKKSAAWAKAKFGEFTEGANGFTLEQTKAHDIAHPITHELTGLDSDAIHKKFGSLKDALGNDALYGEEAIVNVMEQLSRGSSIEASILNGVRLARNMTRPDPNTGVMLASKEAGAYIRSPKFVQDLAETAHKAYRHNDFAPLIGHLRKSNRISGTVTAAGDDFTNSATGG